MVVDIALKKIFTDTPKDDNNNANAACSCSPYLPALASQKAIFSNTKKHILKVISLSAEVDKYPLIPPWNRCSTRFRGLR